MSDLISRQAAIMAVTEIYEKNEAPTKRQIHRALRLLPTESSERIDHGKIFALYHAGWPVQEIARDVRCTPQTVYNDISKWREASAV